MRISEMKDFTIVTAEDGMCINPKHFDREADFHFAKITEMQFANGTGEIPEFEELPLDWEPPMPPIPEPDPQDGDDGDDPIIDNGGEED